MKMKSKIDWINVAAFTYQPWYLLLDVYLLFG